MLASDLLHLTFILSFLSSFTPITSQPTPCSNGGFSFSGMAKNTTLCKKLGALGAELGWSYDNKTAVVDVFFGAKPPHPSGWVAWGINPGPIAQMVGTRSLITFRHRNGSLLVLPYNITVDTKKGCRLQPSEIDLEYKLRAANYSEGSGFITMHVSLTLRGLNLSRLNHVWQVGASVDGVEPRMHGTTLQNFDSCERIDLATGKGKSFGRRRRRLREMHGVLNILGWGTIIPFGIIGARYFKVFPFKRKKWYVFHVGTQLLAFMFGTFGWILGIWLGNTSKSYTFRTHRTLGIIVFSAAVLQILALWLRPNKNDEIRHYWHIYHHLLGYSLFALIVVNIFHGINILRPVDKWKWSYVGLLSGLGLIVLVLEIITWARFLYKIFNKKTNSTTTTEKSSDEKRENDAGGTQTKRVPK